MLDPEIPHPFGGGSQASERIEMQQHFAVLRGIRGDRVYLADPSRGNIRLPMYQFLESWLQDGGTGIIFAVEPTTGLPDEASALPLDVEGGTPLEVVSALERLTAGSATNGLPSSITQPRTD